MILERLALRNWRSYRELHHYSFAPGVNLLVGPNEAGKSTLFEALWRALFDRHGSRARELRRVQPLDSSLGPEVEVIFRRGGQRYKIRKRFLVAPTSELFTERGGEFELDHEGDRADLVLRELLGGEGGRGVSKAEHRGWSHALWLLQREEALPEKAWSEAVAEGLGGLVELVLRSPREESVLKKIDDSYRRVFTASGRISKRSELGRLEEVLPQLGEELERRQLEMERTQQHRSELTELEKQLSGIETRIAAERRRHDELVDRVSRGQEFARDKERQERELESAESIQSTLARALHALRRRQRRIRDLEGALESTSQDELRLNADVRQFRRAAEAHARRWEKEHLPRLQAAEAQIEDLRARLRIDQLEHEVMLWRRVSRQRLGWVEKIEELQARHGSLEVPDAEEWKRLQADERRLEQLEAKAEGGAVRVEVERLDGDGAAKLQVDPEVSLDREREEFLVTRPTTFVIPHIVRLRVRGDAELEKVAEEAAALGARLQESCRKYGLSRLSDLRERVDRARELEDQLRGLSARLSETAEEGDPEGRLRELERELADLRSRSPQAVLPGIEGWALERTHEELRDLEQERSRLQEQLNRERDSEHEAQQRCLDKSEELRSVVQRASGMRSQLKTLREQTTVELEPYGTFDALEAANARAREAVEALTEGIASLRREIGLRVEKPRRELEEAAQRLEGLGEERQRLRAEITDRIARIEEVAQLGLYSETEALRARHERLSERRSVLQQRAEATRLLHLLADRMRKDRTGGLTLPIAERVGGWLAELTGEAYDAIELDEQLLPHALRSTRYRARLPLDSLSHGTHEQVAVLVRLAMAMLLSRDERQLVVLDDRLVNADRDRMERLCAIVQEAAQESQVVLATCRPELYEALAQAHRIDVPAPTGSPPAGLKAVQTPKAMTADAAAEHESE